jgi:hypothetical protein
MSPGVVTQMSTKPLSQGHKLSQVECGKVTQPCVTSAHGLCVPPEPVQETWMTPQKHQGSCMALPTFPEPRFPHLTNGSRVTTWVMRCHLWYGVTLEMRCVHRPLCTATPSPGFSLQPQAAGGFLTPCWQNQGYF